MIPAKSRTFSGWQKNRIGL